jgi:cytochrome c-type biogenesis protein CcmH/NrfF
MMGSYIAAWTAFSAVTLSRLIGTTWIMWLWPLIVGVPAISLTTAYYRRKFAQRKQVAAAD